MGEPLFDADALKPDGITMHDCQFCSAGALATKDELWSSGWIAFDGTSWTGKPLNVRICPNCKEKR